MPMAHVETQRPGGPQSVFANLAAARAGAVDPLAVEGVSLRCVIRLREKGSARNPASPAASSSRWHHRREFRQVFGPYEVDRGPQSVMRSATGLHPTAATHIQQSEVCATATRSTPTAECLRRSDRDFPEQMPYQEWLHSEFRDSRVASRATCRWWRADAVASVVGEPREGLSRHDFRGANFLMLGMLNRFRADLGVVARPAELDAAALRSKAFLQGSSATLSVEARVSEGSAGGRLVVRNLAGHNCRRPIRPDGAGCT